MSKQLERFEIFNRFNVVSDVFVCNTSNSSYREIFNTSRIISQDLNDSHLVLRLSPPNTLKPDVQSRTKM